MDRRKFLRIMGMAGAAAALPWKFDQRRGFQSNVAWAFYQSPGLRLWQTSLRGVGPSTAYQVNIPVAAPDLAPAPVTGVTHYTIDIGQFQDTLHPDLGPTTLWGYNPAMPLGGGSQPQRHLGGIFVVNKGTPIQITFKNKLTLNGTPAGAPLQSIIPVDITVPQPANQAHNRTAVHLHGGLVPWISDGGPFDWWMPNPANGATEPLSGESFLNNQVLNPGAGANAAEYYYPNNQSARFVWYHDHAWGITRTNAYAGIASAYIIRDTFEGNLRNQGLPEFIENSVLNNTLVQELPIVIQDKIFVGPNITTVDPNWPGPTGVGSLWYAHTYETNRWALGKSNLLLPNPSCIPEFFGDTMLVNGTVYPTVNVEPRRYRLRILNATNARFLNLQLFVDDGSPDGVTIINGLPTNKPALINPAPDANLNPGKMKRCLQIGTEGGFLPQPVEVPMNLPFNPALFNGSLLLGNAERADIIVDFRRHAGQNLVLYNDAPAPFPIGDPRNDYYPGAPKNPTLTTPGFGPNTRVIMKFMVAPMISGTADPPLTITPATNLRQGNDSLFFNPVAFGGALNIPATPHRQITLNESFDAYGRLIQMLGTNVPGANGTFGRAYLDTPTETPLAGATEIWQIANLTGDTHPIHFHLVNVQIIARQQFNVPSYNGTPNPQGAPRPPDPNESGWKETVRMNPGEVIWVQMKFDMTGTAIKTAAGGTIPVPSSLRTGTGGSEYVFHCHILEHEEHDMMRPLVVI